MYSLHGRVRLNAQALNLASHILDQLEVEDSQCRIALLEAFAQVPRECFVEQAFVSRAYEDISLPIGFGQTISKPSTVLKMLSCLSLRPGERALEIGAGSGYVSAILARLGVDVYAVEKIGPLAQQTRRRLDALGFQQVMLRCSDGFRGWREKSPFAAIIISAAFESIPDAVLQQLLPDGRLVAPLRELGSGAQRLVLITRNGDGEVLERKLGSCLFVANS